MNESEMIYTFANEQVIRVSGLLSLFMPQTTGVGMMIKGMDGRYQLANDAMEKMLGKSSNQITGATDTDLFPSEVAVQLKSSDEQIINGAAAARDELDFSVNGMPMRCLWLKFPVLGSDGRLISIGAVMIDTSQQDTFTEMRQSLKKLQSSNQDLQKTLVELNLLASTDKLTGAWNRRRFEEVVLNEMDRLKRYDHPLSLFIIDIDFFKKINDTHGHAVGDQVLAELASMIRSTQRTTDSLTRWGLGFG